MLRRTSVLSVLVAFIALFTFQVSPAFAVSIPSADLGASEDGNDKDKGDHDGDADDDSSTSYNEDNDTNDGGTANNVEDDGDNRHPSGKDRSTENGGSGNQGNSESDPDDDGHGPDRSNGGPDKPNGSGGVDKADQDGNNGCGNDDDFEDDNEGWCGGKPKKDDDTDGKSIEVCKDKTMGQSGKVYTCDTDTVGGTKVCEDDDHMVAGSKDCGDDDVVKSDNESICAEVMGTDDEDCDDVLGVIINKASGNNVLGSTLRNAPATVGAAGTAAAPGGVLPFTGGEILPFAAFGLSLIGGGLALARRKN